tara:strand:+ start:767 stop:1687 length:921 start_codon:yes stop_codon:yes gene_type:complete
MNNIPHFTAEEILSFGMNKAILSLKNGMTTSSEPISRGHISLSNEEDFLLMPAFSSNGIGIKLVTVIPRNTKQGLPLVHGFYLYSDRLTGAPKATLDGSALTTLRTPAASAVATEVLARKNVQTLGIFGTGVQARGHVESMLVVRPNIEEIIIFGRNPDSVNNFISSLNVDGRLLVSGTPGEAASCDVICSCTSAKKAIIPTESIREGAHINLIGSFSDAYREADVDLIQNSDVYVDHRKAAEEEAGELIYAVKNGNWSFDKIIGDFLDLITKKVERKNESSITLFKSVGLATWDLLVAESIINQS